MKFSWYNRGEGERFRKFKTLGIFMLILSSFQETFWERMFLANLFFFFNVENETEYQLKLLQGIQKSDTSNFIYYILFNNK